MSIFCGGESEVIMSVGSGRGGVWLQGRCHLLIVICGGIDSWYFVVRDGELVVEGWGQ